jgi:hypothetical protein
VYSRSVNNVSRTWLVGGVWFAALAVTVAGSVAMDARLSTSALLLVMGVAPAAVILLMGLGAPPPTVAEVLHAVDSKRTR